jgi:hypothetical protein
MMSSVAAVPAMHEEMDQRAREKDEIRQNTQQMGAVLRPQKETGCQQEHDQRNAR